jgi:hypothetical protein
MGALHAQLIEMALESVAPAKVIGTSGGYSGPPSCPASVGAITS